MASNPNGHAINMDILPAIRDNARRIVRDMGDAIDRHGARIMEELAYIHSEHEPRHIAQSACIFALMSPQADFSANVQCTQPLRLAIERHASAAELAAIIRSVDLGLHNTKSERLHRMAPFLRSVSADAMHPATLRGYAGFGPKAVAMAIHLANPWANVYTLDRHMLRWVADVARWPNPGGNITPAAYREIEPLLVQYHREHYPDIPVFVSQWALWNDYGFDGEHQQHTGIFTYTPRHEWHGRNG